jgi:hypothetical protein
VYFIPSQFVSTMNNLEDAIAAMPGANVHSLPLVDDRKQRSMVAAGAQEDISGKADDLTDEMAALLQDGSVGVRKHATLLVQVEELAAQVRTYKELLEDQELSVEVRIGGLRAQLQALGQIVGQDKK